MSLQFVQNCGYLSDSFPFLILFCSNLFSFLYSSLLLVVFLIFLVLGGVWTRELASKFELRPSKLYQKKIDLFVMLTPQLLVSRYHTTIIATIDCYKWKESIYVICLRKWIVRWLHLNWSLHGRLKDANKTFNLSFLPIKCDQFWTWLMFNSS